MEQTRLLIVDEHPSVRTYLAARLGREPGFDVICLASDSDQALQCALENQPDVILMDPMMRDGYGFDTIRQIKDSLPFVEVIVLTAYVDTSLHLELKKIGVTNVLEKDLESHRLIDLLREISAARQLPPKSS